MKTKHLLQAFISGNPFPQSEIDEVRKTVDFRAAIQSHLNFKYAVVSAMEGRQNKELPGPIGCSDSCNLGRWMNETAAIYFGELKAFDELKAEHRRFHQAAKEVVELKHAGQAARAKDVFERDFEPSSRRIVSWIHHLDELFGGSSRQI